MPDVRRLLPLLHRFWGAAAGLGLLGLWVLAFQGAVRSELAEREAAIGRQLQRAGAAFRSPADWFPLLALGDAATYSVLDRHAAREWMEANEPPGSRQPGPPSHWRPARRPPPGTSRSSS